MFTSITRPLVLGIALVGAVATASAQNNTQGQPAAVGVSPQTADRAMDKAVPRSDAATVVRTGPTAADKASNAADRAGNAVDRAVTPDRNNTAANNAGSNAHSSANGAATDSANNSANNSGSLNADNTASSRRAARADRN